MRPPGSCWAMCPDNRSSRKAGIGAQIVRSLLGDSETATAVLASVGVRDSSYVVLSQISSDRKKLDSSFYVKNHILVIGFYCLHVMLVNISL